MRPFRLAGTVAHKRPELALYNFEVSLGIKRSVGCESRSRRGRQRGRNPVPVRSKLVPVGSTAPDFTLLSTDDAEVSLRDYRGKHCVALVFLRGFK